MINILETINMLLYSKIAATIEKQLSYSEKRIMSLIEEKLSILTEKNQVLAAAIEAERTQVKEAISQLQSVVADLSSNIQELLSNVDESNKTVAAIAAKLDQQIASVKGAITNRPVQQLTILSLQGF